MYNLIKIVVADSHRDYCSALSTLLTETGFTVLVSLADIAAITDLVDPISPPDIIIIGCSTMYPKSIDTIRQLKNRFPTIIVVANVVFAHYLPDNLLPDTGVDGWMIKTLTEPGTIVRLILILYIAKTIQAKRISWQAGGPLL
jgi:DNA-binding NarL/FixJ family response regulator